MSFFQDTAIGHVLRFVSRGKILDWPENTDEDLRLKYIYGDGKRPSDASSDKMEKGEDYKIIDFLENDPQVSGNIAERTQHRIQYTNFHSRIQEIGLEANESLSHSTFVS